MTNRRTATVTTTIVNIPGLVKLKIPRWRQQADQQWRNKRISVSTVTRTRTRTRVIPTSTRSPESILQVIVKPYVLLLLLLVANFVANFALTVFLFDSAQTETSTSSYSSFIGVHVTTKEDNTFVDGRIVGVVKGSLRVYYEDGKFDDITVDNAVEVRLSLCVLCVCTN